MFNWIESDEEEDHDEEATLLDALEKDLVGSPEVPATHVDPALGFAPDDGFGSRGQSPTILGTIMDPESASAREVHSHHQTAKTSCRCGLWQSDMFTPVQSKRISKFEHRTD